MQVVTAEEMKSLDKTAVETYGIPSLLLMDQASREVAEIVYKELGEISSKIVVFCGKGNNGGDGFGAARWLLNKGCEVKVFLVGAVINDISGDSAYELNMLLRAGGKLQLLASEDDLIYAKLAIMKADLVIDALLGTGYKGELKPLYSKTCLIINELAKKTVAIDIPSGVNADDGSADEAAIKADITVTMAMLKQGLLFQPGKELSGRVMIADIGMPEKLKQEAHSKCYFVNKKIVRELLPIRRPDAHKGDAGRVVVVAGSPGFTGAAAMASYAAVKIGAGLVSLLTPLSCRDILSVKLTEVMVHGLLERMPGVLGGAATGDILKRAKGADVLAVGPGMGTAENTVQVILEVLEKTETPVVIDADGLNCLAGHTEILEKMAAPKVLTPHPGEMSRLTGLSISEINKNPVDIAKKYAAEWKATVVMKGAPTVVATPDGFVYINSTGCNAMATGGSGDILTGIIAGLAGQGISLSEAAICGVFMHGMAGEIATNGAIGLAANEIAQTLPEALKIIQAD